MKKIILLLSLLLFSNLSVAEELKREASVIEGKLENGFKYSIMKNQKPKKRAEFKLLVKIGSIEEENNEKGVAHFIEHLAFNGSKHFKKNELVEYLEKIGLSFGGDLNANTSFERTIYMLTVPLENDNLDTSFLVFSDWAEALSFNKEEVDKERGVVLEEMRMGEGTWRRMFQQYKPLLFGQSAYLEREPIGEKEVIKNISVERIKAFYEKWYRPEFMHFVAVGDFNTTEIESRIKTTFSGLKNKSNEKRTPRVIPENNTTRIVTSWDKEFTSNSVDIFYMDILEETRTEADMRRSLIDSMMITLFNTKAKEQIEKENPKATIIGLSSSSINDDRGFYKFFARYKENDELPALKELYALIWSFNKYGFSANELEPIKESMLSNNEKFYQRIDDLTSSGLSSSLLNYANSKSIFVDYTVDYQLTKKLVKDIKIEEINKLFQKIVAFQDRAIIFKSAKEASYSDKEVLTTIEGAKKEITDLSKTKKIPTNLVIDDLNSTKITHREYNKETDIHQFTLENGIEVAFKQTDFTKNNVVLSGFSFGGVSLYPPKDLLALDRTTLFISRSGVGDYSAIDLNKILANKSVNISTGIHQRSESINGSANNKDVETMFSLLYLQLTKPKVDIRISQNIKNILKAQAQEAMHSPKQKFNQELQEYFFKNNPRIQFETNETIEKLDEKRILELYKERFADLNNFKVIIIGDISLEEVEKLSQKYLGNLPSLAREETYVKRTLPFRKGEVSFSRDYNSENISQIGIQYKSTIPYSVKGSRITDALEKILTIRLRKLIREENSGVYSIGASAVLDMLEDESEGMVQFACDPKRKEELLKMVFKEIEKIKTELVTTEELALYKKGFSTSYETALRRNGYWVSNIEQHYKHGTPLNNIYTLPALIKSINAKDILDMANKIFAQDRILIELNPEPKVKK